jgi:hypothetical protein
VAESDKSGFRYSFFLDQWFGLPLKEYETEATSRSAAKQPSTTKDAQTKAFLNRMLMMPITCFMESSWIPSDCTQSGHVVSLLLDALAGSESGMFRRVGIVMAWKDVSKDVDLEMLKLQFVAHRRPLGSHLFQESHGHGEYTVTVV